MEQGSAQAPSAGRPQGAWWAIAAVPGRARLAGGRGLETGGRRQETGGCARETGGCGEETGRRGQETPWSGDRPARGQETGGGLDCVACEMEEHVGGSWGFAADGTLARRRR